MIFSNGQRYKLLINNQRLYSNVNEAANQTEIKKKRNITAAYFYIICILDRNGKIIIVVHVISDFTVPVRTLTI